MMNYELNKPISVNEIVELRNSVGWNGMKECYNNVLMTSYFHIACYDGNMLIGYIDVVSNGVTDAYIQDLIVNPKYQNKGIGTELMNKTIAYLKEKNIYAISVLFEERLKEFYKKFGFNMMLAGQMETYKCD